MATLAEIEQNLLNASLSGNATLFKSTINSITETQKTQISGSILADTLYNITQLSSASTAASMTRTMMSALGSHIDTYTIGFAMA
ncbi:MAG: hypothetical protein KDI13_03080, partial [Alphaproteobacteria bacterium]|nr:hypothetical protein [Alphaproteobacteria bacterium]